MKRSRLRLGRYDWAVYSAFICYAVSSLALPLAIVDMADDLNFRLDAGGMTAGGGLHLLRSAAVVVMLLGCGALAGKIGKRRSMGLSMFLTGAGICACSLSTRYWMLLPFLFAAGLGEGLCEGIATPFVEGLHREETERYVNIAHGFWSVGIAAAVLLAGGILSSGVSWRAVLALSGLAALGTCLLFFWRENPDKRYPESAGETDFAAVMRRTLEIAKVPRFWVYCLGMFAGAGAEFCLTFWSAAYLQLHFHTGIWTAALGTGAIASGMFVSRVGFGYFARKDRLKQVLLLCGLCNIPLAFLLARLTPEMFSNPVWMVLTLALLLVGCGICIGPYWPTLQVYGVSQLPELDSTMLYIYFSATGIPGCGLFTWLIGVLGDKFGMAGGFYMIPALLAVFCIVIFLEGWVFPRRDLSRSN